jgi:DNA-binding LytR/AlgR family response regulator
MSTRALFLSTATGNRYAIVDVSSIVYLTGSRDITYLFTTSGVIDTILPLHYFEKALSHEKFCKIHDTHLIAIERIISFDASNVLMPGALLPIGESFVPALRASIRVLEDGCWFINNEGRLEEGTGELQ